MAKKKKKELTIYKRICAYCGVEFETIEKNQQTCCAYCEGKHVQHCRKVEPEKMSPMARVNHEGRKQGLSYGQMRAAIWLEQQKVEAEKVKKEEDDE